MSQPQPKRHPCLSTVQQPRHNHDPITHTSTLRVAVVLPRSQASHWHHVGASAVPRRCRQYVHTRTPIADADNTPSASPEPSTRVQLSLRAHRRPLRLVHSLHSASAARFAASTASIPRPCPDCADAPLPLRQLPLASGHGAAGAARMTPASLPSPSCAASASSAWASG